MYVPSILMHEVVCISSDASSGAGYLSGTGHIEPAEIKCWHINLMRSTKKL
jgi:hypothetical protein